MAMSKDGKPFLTKEPKLLLNDNNAGKPEGIHLMIGRRPYAAFGNSTGDQQMLEYTKAGDGARLAMLVLHDDAEREYAYGPAAGPARHQGRHLHPGALRRGEEERLDRHQHEERLEEDLPGSSLTFGVRTMGVAAKRRAQAKAEAERKPDEMIFIPGGTFRMGSDKHYPEEAPAHRVTVDGFWIDPTPVTNAQFRQFVEATGHVTFAEIAPDPDDYPGALPHMLQARARSSSCRRKARSTAATGANGGRSARRRLAAPLRARQLDQGPRRSPRRARRLSAMPRPTPNGPARSCRPRPSGNSPRAADLMARSSPGAMSSMPGGKHMANTWQGEFPAEPDDRRLRAHLAGRHFPAERLRPLRHDRQRLGVDHRLVSARSTPADAPKACCIPQNPRGGARGGELRSLPAQDQDSAQGAQGRLASLRAELLPPLSAGRAARRADRHLDLPSSASAASNAKGPSER